MKVRFLLLLLCLITMHSLSAHAQLGAPAPLRSIDTDHDGIVDDEDQCPTIAGPADRGGCPENMPPQVRITLLYPSASASLPQDLHLLQKAIDTLKKNPPMQLLIEGHTDSLGTARHNASLALRRALGVKKYAMAHGLSSQRITIKAWGSTQPTAPNNTPEERAQNRRTVITLLPPPSP